MEITNKNNYAIKTEPSNVCYTWPNVSEKKQKNRPQNQKKTSNHRSKPLCVRDEFANGLKRTLYARCSYKTNTHYTLHTFGHRHAINKNLNSMHRSMYSTHIRFTHIALAKTTKGINRRQCNKVTTIIRAYCIRFCFIIVVIADSLSYRMFNMLL